MPRSSFLGVCWQPLVSLARRSVTLISVYMVFSLGAQLCSNVSFLLVTSCSRLGPTLVTSPYTSLPLYSLVSKSGHMLRVSEL